MFLPDRPRSNEHVLHHQPRLSSLGRQRELAEKAVGLWTTRVRQTKPVARGGSKDTKGAVRIPNNNSIGATVAEVSDDVRGPTRTASSDGLGVASHPLAPRAIPHRSGCWGEIRSSTCGRQSSEWETETLLDHSSGSPEDMAPYPCPFRQRNPARFNVRDHEVCARAPFTMRELKHHIITHHGRKPIRHQCRRCNEQFKNEGAFERHLLLPRDQMCEVKASPPIDYEEGIADEIASVMAARDSTEKGWTWEGIWRLVFPSDEVPEPNFQPVTELVEVEQAFDESQETLKESLREKLQLLLPETVDRSYLSFLTGQLELVFETHRVNVMKQSLGRGCQTVSGTPPSETQTTEQQSPPRKPNRRSRRNTILQALQRNSNSQDTATGLASRRTSRASSAKHASHQFSEQSFLCRTEQHDRLSTNTIPGHLHNPTDTHDKYNNTTNPINPRDSRDSGIGMPCDACDLDPCTCTSDTETSPLSKSIHHAAEQYYPKKRPWQQHPRKEEESTNANTISRRSRLSIQTEDLHLRPRFSLPARAGEQDRETEGAGVIAAAVGGGGGSGSDGGRFSPESFKQRVLRQQLMGV